MDTKVLQLTEMYLVSRVCMPKVLVVFFIKAESICKIQTYLSYIYYLNTCILFLHSIRKLYFRATTTALRYKSIL